MSDICKPAMSVDDPDRFLECQDAMDIAFQDLANRAVAAGWSEREVAAALVDLADNHMLMHDANADTEAALAKLKRRS